MLAGAEVVLVPNAGDIEANRLAQLRARASENMVAVAMANYAGPGFGHSVAFDGHHVRADRDSPFVRVDAAGQPRPR